MRLRELMKANGWTQQSLADYIGVARSTVGMWVTGRNEPDNTTLSQLAELFSCSVDYLLGRTDDPADYDNDDLSDVRQEIIDYFNGDVRKIRQFLKVEEEDARKEAYATQLPSNVRPISALHRQRVPLIGSAAAGEPIYVPEEMGVYVESPVDADAAITVKGDSMEPTYLDGDVVYIKCCPDIPEGAVAVVFMDDEATIKHVYKRPTGLTLWSDNTSYAPMQIEFEDYACVRIFGVPVGYTRIYKSGIEGKIRKGFQKNTPTGLLEHPAGISIPNDQERLD